LAQLKYLDISNNSLQTTSVEQIVEDLYTNYTNAPRGGVTINLKNSLKTGATFSEDTLDTIILLQAKGWTVIIQ